MGTKGTPSKSENKRRAKDDRYNRESAAKMRAFLKQMRL